MVWIGMWLLGVAQAAPRTICLEASVSYDDVDIGGEEDYFQTNANRPLRGGLLYYKPSTSPGYAGTYVSFEGTTPGCITLNLNPLITYDLKVASQARVDGRDIDVVNSVTGLPWERNITAVQFLAPGTRTFVVNPPSGQYRIWNVLAASSFALHRRHGSISGYDVTFHLTNAAGVLSSPCSGGSCIVGTDIYLQDDLAHRKFDIAYAMGRTFLNSLGLTSAQVTNQLDNDHCGPTTAGIALHSIERDSAAAVAGYAWFYAATVFNKTNESDCGMVSRNAADWDMQGGVCYDEVESPAGHTLSCAIGPTLVPRKNQRQYCADRHIGNDPADTSSVPIDWVRFLWALQFSGAEDFASITSLFDTAITGGSWTSTGTGVHTAFTAAGLFTGASGTLAAEHGVTP